MFGIAATHLAAYVEVAALPEASEVAGPLQRASCRREQFNGHRQLVVEDGWSFLAAEHLLQFHSKHHLLILIAERCLPAGGDAQAQGQQPIQLLALLPAQLTPEGLLQAEFIQVSPAEAALQACLLYTSDAADD